MKMRTRAVAGLLALFPVSATSLAANSTVAGEPLMEPPTLISLGIEWPIQGDDNRNAAVTVEYRKKGEAAWKRALDLLRLQGEESFLRGALDYKAPNMFSGSIFDLQEDSDYEIRLSLSDPDGAVPETAAGSGTKVERTIAARTRAEPRPASGGRVYHVYPPGFT